ncbi:MAG: hypothetical protein QOG31_1409 [Thermoplasmata archaeon]|jgi:hypothetical protein|nr:hypothetical protein [Thermoplasmata archaeon]
MTKPKNSKPRKPKQSWSDLAVATNIVVQAVEPFTPAVQAAMNGDMQGAMNAAKPALKEAVSARNIAQMAIPVMGRGLQKRIASALKIRSPKVFGRKIW